jgi:hypothetical protein
MVREIFTWVRDDIRNAQPLDPLSKVFLACVGAAATAQAAVVALGIYTSIQCHNTDDPSSKTCQQKNELIKTLDEPGPFLLF